VPRHRNDAFAARGICLLDCLRKPKVGRRMRDGNVAADVFIGGSMAYMLLIVEPVDQRDERGEVAGREVFAEMVRYRDTLNDRGVLISAESLATAKKGKRLQVHDGKARVVDGPFAEAKEMIGGFFLVDCETQDEALSLAAECPAARWCTIEVRKLAPCYE
jgi:hypothetical protein